MTMNEETIELFYISDYDLDGEWEKQKQGVSVISRGEYLNFFVETEWEPCACDVQGCMSCFLEEKGLWAAGYGKTATSLWFGVDPATGKQWNPEAVLAERRKGVCQWCYEQITGDEGHAWGGVNYHSDCLEDMGVGQ